MQDSGPTQVARNLEWLIAKAGTNPYAIEDELRRRGYKGPSQPTIHRILTGESQDPKTATLAPLAELFGVSVTDLREKNLETEAPSAILQNVSPAAMRGLLPLISSVQAGNWSDIIDQFQPGDAEDWLPCPFKHSKEAFVLRVDGYSNYNPGGEKSYTPGEFIAVDPGREPTNKSMVVAKIDGEERATFKQLIIEPDGTHLLQALNPSWPNRIMPLPPDSRIVGVVIGKWTAE